MRKTCAAVTILTVLLSACQPYRVNSRGNLLINEHVKSFKIGQTTTQEVLQKCGTPSLHQDSFNWLYVGAISEESAFKPAKLKDRSVIKLTFNSSGILTNIQEVELPQSDAIAFDQDREPLINEKQVNEKVR